RALSALALHRRLQPAAASAGELILRLTVVRHTTARCTCSESAAGLPLQVAGLQFGQIAAEAAAAPGQTYAPPRAGRAPPDAASIFRYHKKQGNFTDAEFARP